VSIALRTQFSIHSHQSNWRSVPRTAATDTICGLALSPDDQRLATASLDSLFKIWDVAAGRVEHAMRGHDGRVYTLRFHPDGHWVASPWNVAAGAAHWSQSGHGSLVYSVDFQPGGALLASGSDDGTICIRTSPDGTLVAPSRDIRNTRKTRRALSSSIDGTHLVSGGRDCTMAVRDVESGEELPGLDVINNGINSTQFIPDDKWLSSEQRRPAHPGLEPGQQRSAL
jgi:WD40 repeat protein